MTVRADHFVRVSIPSRARFLFRRNVEQIEIETHTFCNRTCWFCPNSYIDRRSANHRMDEGLYLRILRDLVSIGYKQSITFSRYNEPLADRIILTRIKQARDQLPAAKIFTHTNGDYLNRAYLDELRAAGLDKLRVQVYGNNDDRTWDDDEVLARMNKRMEPLGLPFDFLACDQGKHYAARHYYGDLEVIFEATNFSADMLDRGQTLTPSKPYERTAPCKLPFNSIYIDWNGKVVPCCNIRSDEPKHVNYIVDDLSTGRSIFQAYADSALVEWRKELYAEGPKKAPCNTCSYMV